MPLDTFLHNSLNPLVHTANKVGLQEKKYPIDTGGVEGGTPALGVKEPNFETHNA
jgi:hypothetical protein